MEYVYPEEVLAPKKKWNLIEVLYDGGAGSYAVAKGTWEEKLVTVIRWNGTCEKLKGNPVSRGYPTWFVLPEQFIKDEFLGKVRYSWCKKYCLELSNEVNAKENFKKGAENIDSLLYLIAVGDTREPLKNFLNLVKNHHKKDKGNIKEVIITDPYILYEHGESGNSGGYIHLVDYLKTLGITKECMFTFKYLQSPKGQSVEKIKFFKERLKREFINITFKTLNMQFHDRLYIVKNKSAEYSGLFGPSLNGLTAQSIVLMGELEENTIKGLCQLGLDRK